MNKKTLINFIASIALAGSAFWLASAFLTSAASIFDIQFPIPELGNCADRAACKIYCDDLSHAGDCAAFAKKYGLADETAAKQAKNLPKTGPGGCAGQDACKTYCDDASHLDECVAFGKEHGLITDAEAERAKQFANQTGPGGCKGQECRTYCDDPDHQEECFNFAKDKHLLSSEDEKNFEVGKKLRATVAENGGPGGCKSEKECRAYCADASHVEECAAFAVAHAGISQQEAEKQIQQFTKNISQIQEQSENPKDFQNFQQKSLQRFQEFQQLERQFRGPNARQTETESTGPQQFKGPGGCSSPSECIQYCSEHASDCFNMRTQSMPAPPSGAPQSPSEENNQPERQFNPQQIYQQIHPYQPMMPPPQEQQQTAPSQYQQMPFPTQGQYPTQPPTQQPLPPSSQNEFINLLGIFVGFFTK